MWPNFGRFVNERFKDSGLKRSKAVVLRHAATPTLGTCNSHSRPGLPGSLGGKYSQFAMAYWNV